MDKCNVALYGCGTVGTGVAQVLLSRGALGERIGDRVKLKYVVDARLDEVRRALQQSGPVIVTDDLDQPLADPEVNVVVELFGGMTAARTVVERALASGRDVITANKALLASYGDELFRLARAHGRAIGFEGSVGGGIPVIGAIRDGLVANRIERIYGIVNGTCNYVLTRMLERDMLYARALAEAQERGYAEADPRLDVEGLDSAHKLAVLARLAFGVNVKLEHIACEGIAHVELSDLRYAQALGYTLKLLAIGIRRGERLELRVHPSLLRKEHPVAGIGGVFNAVCIHTSHAGEVVLTGQGAGRMPTTSAVLSDIAAMALGTYPTDFAALSQFGDVPDADVVPVGDIQTRYYFRLDCADRPGVLAKVAAILGEEDISIASLRQQEPAGPGKHVVPVVFMTHHAREASFRRALDRINQLDVVRGDRTRFLRVEDI
jgi:homoserine dehydrogenase